MVLIHPESGLIGKTLREAAFRSEFGLHVLGMRRAREPVADFADTKLTAADSLFVAGAWSRIRQLHAMHHDFVVLEVPAYIIPSPTEIAGELAVEGPERATDLHFGLDLLG